MKNYSILVVDDELPILQMLEMNLKMQGFDVLTATSGTSCIEMAGRFTPDLILLDIMMPGIDGIETCSILKERRDLSHIPVIMVSAKSEQHDRIAGLRSGADDYVTKPFNLIELSLRIKAALRQVEILKERMRTSYELGDLRLDASSYEVTVSQVAIDLTLTEFRILYHLIASGQQPVSKERIAAEVFSKQADQTGRTIDVHIRNLRRKLERSRCEVTTVRGFGYRLDTQESPR